MSKNRAADGRRNRAQRTDRTNTSETASPRFYFPAALAGKIGFRTWKMVFTGTPVFRMFCFVRSAFQRTGRDRIRTCDPALIKRML